MFTSVSVANFRCFRELRLKGLDRVNLIAGKNNVGKSSLLEALFLLLGETNLALAFSISASRGLAKIETSYKSVSAWVWAPMFHLFDKEKEIMLGGKRLDEPEMKVTIGRVPPSSVTVSLEEGPLESPSPQSPTVLEATYQCGKESRTSHMYIHEGKPKVAPPPPQPTIPGYFHPARGMFPKEDAKSLADLLIRKESYDLVDILKIIEPRITQLSTMPGPGDESIIYGDVGLGQMLPLVLMGEGLVRFTSFLLKIAMAAHGVVLIDEIENGLHHSVMDAVWTAIAEAARLFDVQVFATTHSWECVVAAHRAFQDSGTYDFRLHRLDRVDDQIRAVTYDQEKLATAIASGLEVR